MSTWSALTCLEVPTGSEPQTPPPTPYRCKEEEDDDCQQRKLIWGKDRMMLL